MSEVHSSILWIRPCLISSMCLSAVWILLYHFQQSHWGPLWYLQKVLVWSWRFNIPEDWESKREGRRETDWGAEHQGHNKLVTCWGQQLVAGMTYTFNHLLNLSPKEHQLSKNQPCSVTKISPHVNLQNTVSLKTKLCSQAGQCL